MQIVSSRALRVLFVLLSLTSCIAERRPVVERPHGCRHPVWVEGHRGPHGHWHPGYWRCDDRVIVIER
jgi:hypothetical protein